VRLYEVSGGATTSKGGDRSPGAAARAPITAGGPREAPSSAAGREGGGASGERSVGREPIPGLQLVVEDLSLQAVPARPPGAPRRSAPRNRASGWAYPCASRAPPSPSRGSSREPHGRGSTPPSTRSTARSVAMASGRRRFPWREIAGRTAQGTGRPARALEEARRSAAVPDPGGIPRRGGASPNAAPAQIGWAERSDPLRWKAPAAPERALP